ncbi:MAG: spermidine/putrescine transporter permease [Alphaproteobacteria bacterium]|jgi:putrescine transport system permease protein|nr:spermidine/putrescine transporter permease [Alphaproteobacteria bacterium]
MTVRETFASLGNHFWNRLARERRLVIAAPYLWLGLFSLIPFILVVKISLSQPVLAIPPFHPLFQWSAEQVLQLQLNLATYSALLTEPFYASAFISSLKIAFIATLSCLLIGYPIAYAIVQSSPQWRPILLLLIILPFFTSFLVRVYAWIGLLSTEGVINTFLQWTGIIHEPLPLLYNSFAVTIGIVYCYLPFMILPIYSVLDKIDPAYQEAAYDLGCRPWRTFWRVTVPLSFRAISAGSILVFVPAIGEFVIPELLGAPETLMIGRVLWNEFFHNQNWPLACALALMMLVIFVVPFTIFQRFQLGAKEE